MMSQDAQSRAMRTPLKNVRSLGSAKEGAAHFWQQRMTAIANLFLTMFMVGLLVRLLGADYATVRATLANPIIALLLLALVLSGIFHMRLGMQVIIEDYVRSEGAKLMCLMLNTFFAIAIGLTCVFAILKLSFGA
jgi:succinate dehydrogenase / fumarate reductase, membrane anchor subunit